MNFTLMPGRADKASRASIVWRIFMNGLAFISTEGAGVKILLMR